MKSADVYYVSHGHWTASADNNLIWGPPKVSNKYQKMLKLDDAFFEGMPEKM